MVPGDPSTLVTSPAAASLPALLLLLPQPVTVTGAALRPPSATAGLATAFACQGCLACAVTSAPEASLDSFPVASPATSASGTGIASYR